MDTGARAGAPADRRLKTFARRHGHRLRQGRGALLADLLPRLRIGLPPDGQLDPGTLFAAPPREIWLEIGFGAGEHLLCQAQGNRDVGCLGAEPFVNGIARLLAGIAETGLENIRIHDGDARDLLDRLPAACLARVFILFPDPWPKARHHKRRIINAETVSALARVIRPGGELRIASDIADYQRWILGHVLAAPDFDWTATRAADWRQRPADWPATRYEQKALAAGRPPAFLSFRRR